MNAFVSLQLKQRRRQVFSHRNFVKKLRENQLDFATIKITWKKVETMWIFRPSKLRRYKHVENMYIFGTSETTLKKAGGKDVDFSISKITSKNYVEIT